MPAGRPTAIPPACCHFSVGARALFISLSLHFPFGNCASVAVTAPAAQVHLVRGSKGWGGAAGAEVRRRHLAVAGGIAADRGDFKGGCVEGLRWGREARPVVLVEEILGPLRTTIIIAGDATTREASRS